MTERHPGTTPLLHGMKLPLFNLFSYVTLSIAKYMRYLTTCIKVKNIEGDLLTGVLFLSRSILTWTKAGHIKLWIRPLALKPRLKNSRTVDMDPLT